MDTNLRKGDRVLEIRDVKKQLAICQKLSVDVQRISRMGVYVFDVHSGTWTSSEVLDKIFGIDKKYKRDVAGWLNIVSLEDREELKKYFLSDVLKDRKKFNKIYRITNVSTGKEMWVHGYGDLEIDAKGEVSRMVGTIQDITIEKQLEINLKESEVKYRRLYDTMMDAFVIVDMNGMIQDCNDTYLKMLGYKKSEICKLTYMDITPKKWQAFEQKIVDTQLMPKSISDVYEKEYIRKDGRIFPVELRTSLIKDEKGKSILMWAVVRDITEKKHIENALLEEEKKLKSILVNTRYGIALTDKQDKFVMVNPYFCNLIGYSESELMEMSYKDITYAEDLAESGNQMNLLKERKIKNFSLIKRYVRKDKKIIWGKVGVGAIYDDKKEVAYSVISLEDITESRNEDQVRKDFVSLAGHQLRTPLTGIKWFVELARVNAGNISNNELNQYLNNISESNERLIHLVNDLLRVSKVDSGKLSKTGFSKNKIEDLILSSIAEQKTMILDKKVKVTGLNKLGKNLSIKCDRLQVLEALGNVINNAIKYSLVGSEIRIGIIEGEAKVALVVEDKGIGIPKEQQPRLFEKFFRADNVEKTVTGSGLGLYLVKNLVEYNNGKIWIESKEGKGTKVFMEFPKCK